MSNAYGIEGTHLFITGGAGFIGTALARRLAAENRITLYDNLHHDALRNSGLTTHPNVEFIEGDVLDREHLLRAMAPSLDYVIHCAAIAGVDRVLRDPLRTLEVNLQGTFHVLEGCARLPGLKRFAAFSTSEVYGPHADNVPEELIRPTIAIGEARWTYSISKLAGEFIAHAYQQKHQVPTVTIRPFNVYGPNQVGVGAIRQFVVQALQDQDLQVHNDGLQVRAWCYIDDLVHGSLLAMTRTPRPGRCYNIGNPDSALTVAALARLVVEMAQSKSRLVFKPLDYPDVEVRIPDIQLARTELGFEPQIDLEEGVRRTVDWFRVHVPLAAKKIPRRGAQTQRKLRSYSARGSI